MYFYTVLIWLFSRLYEILFSFFLIKEGVEKTSRLHHIFIIALKYLRLEKNIQ